MITDYPVWFSQNYIYKNFRIQYLYHDHTQMHSATLNACAYQHHCNIALIPTKLLPSHKHNLKRPIWIWRILFSTATRLQISCQQVLSGYWKRRIAIALVPCHHCFQFSYLVASSFQLPFQSLWWPVPSVTIKKTVDSISAPCFVPGFHAGVWFPAYPQKAVVLDKCFQQQSAVLRSFVCVCRLLLVLFVFFSWHVLLHHYHFAHLLCLCIQRFDL